MYTNAECPSVHQVEYIAAISYVLNLTKPANPTKTEAQNWLRRYTDVYRQVQNTECT